MAIVHLPADRDRLDDLRRVDAPRLLVLDVDGPPPPEGSCVEDWVRHDADPTEFDDRLEALRVRARRHRAAPSVDDAGVLHFRDDFVPLSPVEQPLVRALVERVGHVVGRDELLALAWPGAEPSQNLLDVHILRLRRRLEPTGLRIRTARGRGYALTVAGPDAR